MPELRFMCSNNHHISFYTNTEEPSLECPQCGSGLMFMGSSFPEEGEQQDASV